MKLASIGILGIFILGYSSCEKETTPVATSTVNYTISGSVNLYDDGVIELTKKGMTITLEGVSSTQSTGTDLDGNFTFSGVPYGTYVVSYEKLGYGTYRKYDVAHIRSPSGSTNITDSPSLGQVSTTKVIDLSVQINVDTIRISAETDPGGFSNNIRYVRYFLSTATAVSNEEYMYFSPVLVAQSNPYDVSLTKQNLTDLGFASGSTVYAKFYGDSYWSNVYENPSTGKTIFPNINGISAPAVSFIVP